MNKQDLFASLVNLSMISNFLKISNFFFFYSHTFQFLKSNFVKGEKLFLKKQNLLKKE